jgi:uncharacterized integral membrane protein
VTHDSSGRSLYQKARLYGLISVGAVALVVIFQNTQEVETQVLFWTLRLPRAALLASTLLAGFAGGVVWTGFRRRKS